ncbi:hypothetical protein [Dyadobacter diqingensis]|uniref:hypothetical protein n=1 Tax=Dyadobacter diqingensis TaxID=2938121 RepID=UPI0020C18B48|nr:hypothetical protein [Dyadobacter diqingensis]
MKNIQFEIMQAKNERIEQFLSQYVSLFEGEVRIDVKTDGISPDERGSGMNQCFVIVKFF